VATEASFWGIHGGRTGDADQLFLKGGCVALGWPKAGDLSALKADREAFKAKVAEAYPDKKRGAIPGDAGMLIRFVHEIRPDDVVVYPSKIDRQVHIGQIKGGYVYDPARDPKYPQQRAVKWLHAIPRTHFSQGALYEIGSSLSFFQIKNYVEEFKAAIAGEEPLPPPVDEAETVARIAEDIEENTRDFVLKQLVQKLKGHPLAEFVAHLLGAMGYRTRVSPPGPDDGIDIIAHRDELGFEPPIIKVQVKSTEGSVGAPIVAALLGNVGQGEHGLFVTLGTFTSKARTSAHGKTNLRLVDGDMLVSLILQHYEQFDAQYKGLIPLKRVYVPEGLEEEE